MTFTRTVLTALVFTASIAHAAERPASRLPAKTSEAAAMAKVQQAGVHKVLARVERGALKGVFGDSKAFADKLGQAMDAPLVASPR